MSARKKVRLKLNSISSFGYYLSNVRSPKCSFPYYRKGRRHLAFSTPTWFRSGDVAVACAIKDGFEVVNPKWRDHLEGEDGRWAYEVTTYAGE